MEKLEQKKVINFNIDFDPERIREKHWICFSITELSGNWFTLLQSYIWDRSNLFFVFKFIKHHFDRNYIRIVYFTYIFFLISGFFKIFNIWFINEKEFYLTPIIAFFKFPYNFNISKIPRYKRSVILLKNFHPWKFIKKSTIRFKKYFTPKGFQIKRIIHEFDFFDGNKTELKYTAKSSNKKDEIWGNLTDIKIDLKNLNGRQISCLYAALERSCHSAVFKEEKELFAKIISCLRDSKSIIHGYDDLHPP